MKICQVLASRGTGGLERHFADLCNELSLHHQVIAVAHPEFCRRLRQDVQLEAVDLTGWRRNPVTSLRLVLCIRRHHPDIVHAQANKAAAMVAAVRFALGGARRVATVHNLKRDCSMFRSFDRVIAVSRRAARQIGHDRVDVVYNGIALSADAEPLNGARVISPGGVQTPTAIAVGRLVPAKGFDVLLQAWSGVDANLMIVGEGPQRARLESLINELALGDRVRLLGYRHDVPMLLAGADLVIISSRREGFSYVLAEALQARRVVISTRVPVADEVLPETFLVDTDQPAALHAKITQVLGSPEQAREAFETVWRYAAQTFTIERMTVQTEEVYRRALEGAQP